MELLIWIGTTIPSLIIIGYWVFQERDLKMPWPYAVIILTFCFIPVGNLVGTFSWLVVYKYS